MLDWECVPSASRCRETVKRHFHGVNQRGLRVHVRACFFICLSTNRRIEIAETEHLAGNLNVLSDGLLSRGVSSESLGFSAYQVIDFLSCPVTKEVLRFMDPTAVMDPNDNCIFTLFSSARNLLVADLLASLYEPVE